MASRRADLPPVDPELLKQQMMEQLDAPRIARIIRDLSDGTLDITFRVSRRRISRGPKITVMFPEVE